MALYVESTDLEAAPVGFHRGKVLRVEEFPPPADHPDWKWSYRITYELVEALDSHGRPYRVVERVPKTWSRHPKSKLRPRVQAILARTLTNEERQRFDVQSVVGRECALVLEDQSVPGGEPKVVVASVLPVNGRNGK